jgi:hypothetical protein
MQIDQLPTPPQTGQDEEEFVQNADNLFAALPTFANQVNSVTQTITDNLPAISTINSNMEILNSVINNMSTIEYFVNTYSQVTQGFQESIDEIDNKLSTHTHNYLSSSGTAANSNKLENKTLSQIKNEVAYNTDQEWRINHYIAYKIGYAQGGLASLFTVPLIPTTSTNLEIFIDMNIDSYYSNIFAGLYIIQDMSYLSNNAIVGTDLTALPCVQRAGFFGRDLTRGTTKIVNKDGNTLYRQRYIIKLIIEPSDLNSGTYGADNGYGCTFAVADYYDKTKDLLNNVNITFNRVMYRFLP